jgi:hypothetical protein
MLHRPAQRRNVSPSEAIGMGERVCSLMSSGISEDQLIQMLVDPPHPVPRLTAIDFVVESHVYLCPQVSINGGSYGPSTHVA